MAGADAGLAPGAEAGRTPEPGAEAGPEALWDACFDFTAPVVFFPLRHHSPACALHLLRALEEYGPDAILIEGPSDTNELIPHIGAAENVAPLCIYYNYREAPPGKARNARPDAEPELAPAEAPGARPDAGPELAPAEAQGARPDAEPDAGLEKEAAAPDADPPRTEYRSACYYPLLDFSPELCAIRYGTARQIETRFIDLPYSRLSLIERAAAGRAPKPGEDDLGGAGGSGDCEEKSSYYDDYYLFRSDFIRRLCEKQGCRHYGELWEKLFELRGPAMPTPEFVRAMLALCHYSRRDYPDEMLRDEGCLEREAWMAAEIGKARKKFARILVVTGGFHTAALAERIWGIPGADVPTPDNRPAAGIPTPGIAPSAHTPPLPIAPALPTGKAQAWLIPYSFEESDQLAGYASGMPYPAFYQSVFEQMRQGSAEAYDQSVLLFLARIGGALRKEKESTSIADEVAALAQARGLADLREKPQQGVYELLDATRSAYVKGAMDLSASRVMNTAVKLLRGDRIGSVTSGVSEVPLLLDFRETARKLRLKIHVSVKQESTLDILTNPAHRAASVFFHRMDFLHTQFCELKFGPSYRDRDTGRVREKWAYAAGERVESAVIDVSYLGGTVREAASSALIRSKEGKNGAGAYARLLIDAAVMGLTEHVAPLLSDMKAAVAEDGDFSSLLLAAQNLLFMENAAWLLALPKDGFASELLSAVYVKAATLLPALETADDKEDYRIAAALKDLHRVSLRAGFDAQLLTEGLRELCDRSGTPPPPCMQGAAAGLLYASGVFRMEDLVERASAFLFGTGQQMKRSGRFLSGLFLSAWDVMFESPGDAPGFT
ncbi:MAG: DUF5682 family protein, partial [Clostridiales Family XIII bacterium]|nr:DUF5682 family protein [Clostridiales Family XIII bacterium]